VRDASATPDAIAPDAGTTPRASCPPGALLCESFEDGAAIDATRWRVNADAGAFVLDGDHAADGARSLHLRYGMPYGFLGAQFIATRAGIAAPSDRVYVRA